MSKLMRKMDEGRDFKESSRVYRQLPKPSVENNIIIIIKKNTSNPWAHRTLYKSRDNK